MITTPYSPDNLLRTRRRIRQQRWSRLAATPCRFFLVIGLLLFTAHRLPAPVVEGPPPFRRTFFTLKGHAVDTFVKEQKLPPELNPTFGGFAPVLTTKPLTEITGLMRKFGRVVSEPPTRLITGFEDDAQTPEIQRREAAIQKLAKSQLKKIATTPTLPAATRPRMTFEASKFPPAFFTDRAWSVTDDRADELLTKGVNRPNRARIEIPIATAPELFSNLQLFRYAVRGDIEILRRASVNTEHKDDPQSALMQFWADVCRSGTPQRLLPITVSYDLCWSSTIVTIDPPPLEIRVLVLENITNGAIELGQFHFRLLDPGQGILTVRTRAENEQLLASVNANSELWYKRRMLKPGEKVIVPLEILFKSGSWTDSGAATTRARRRICANKLLADRELQTIALMYEGKERTPSFSQPENPIPLFVMPKQKFVDALLREPVRSTEKEEFVYGPSIVLDSVDVNRFRYPIEPLDPINVAYYSGADIGSCPFVYTRRTTQGDWLKQGTILTGRSSKAREGTATLKINAFDGTLRIAEEEEEISYIDELFVRGTLANGERVTLRPADNRITHKDLRYLVLKKGESAEIKFSAPNGMLGDPVEVVSSGYFELSQRPVAQ
jgi:hypothetical protein